MIHYLYNFIYSDKCSSGSKMAFAVKVYAIADKYEIDQLQALAATKFKSTFKLVGDGKETELIDETAIIDEWTNPNDNTLRDVAMPVIQEHISTLLKVPDFKELIRTNEDFTFRLISMVGPKNSSAYFETPMSPVDETGGVDPRAIWSCGRRLGR